MTRMLPARRVLLGAVALASLALAQRAGGRAGPGDGDHRDAALLRSDPFQARREDSNPSVMPSVASASLVSDELLEPLLAPDQWAAVSYVVDWPGASVLSGRFRPEVPRTSGTAEDLIGRRPDLVVVGPFNRASTSWGLRQVGVAVHELPVFERFEEISSAWLELGRRVGRAESAAAQVAEFERRLAALVRVPSPASAPTGERWRVLCVQGGFAYGPGTLQHDCLSRLGASNVAEPGTPPVTSEWLLATDPDVVFLASEQRRPHRIAPSSLPDGHPWHLLRAVQRQQVWGVPAPWMSSQSHHALEACRAYGAILTELAVAGEGA